MKHKLTIWNQLVRVFDLLRTGRSAGRRRPVRAETRADYARRETLRALRLEPRPHLTAPISVPVRVGPCRLR